MNDTSSAGYYIASLKHTNQQDEHIRWWGKDHCGYTPVLGDYAGIYTEADAAKLNDGFDTLAVPVELVRALASPEPYFRNSRGCYRFYDQRGPVVLNDLQVWVRLIDGGLPGRGRTRVKPCTFRGKRRGIFTEPPAQPASSDIAA